MRVRWHSGLLAPSWLRHLLLCRSPRRLWSPPRMGHASFSFHHVRFVPWDVALQFCLPEEAVTRLSSGNTSLTSSLLPVWTPIWSHLLCFLPLVPASLCLFISSTSLTGTPQLGLLFPIHSGSLCFLILQFSSLMFISMVAKVGFRSSVSPHPSGLEEVS